MKIVVTGGRRYNDLKIVYNALDRVHSLFGVEFLAEGGATGADAQAAIWAYERSVEHKKYPAKWEDPCRDTCSPNHRRAYPWGDGIYCPAAGVYRNHDMHDAVGPDIVVAFPGGKGTADMMAWALSHGTTVLQFTGGWADQEMTKALFRTLPESDAPRYADL